MFCKKTFPGSAMGRLGWKKIFRVDLGRPFPAGATIGLMKERGELDLGGRPSKSCSSLLHYLFAQIRLHPSEFTCMPLRGWFVTHG